ncbi:LysE family transporter [Streptomyces sp. NPDC091371]|uniref:LysE family transporter n=1 Tax=Streptomyces sp. NPDC091371 TaxID=3155303 RepID=UPI00341601BF
MTELLSPTLGGAVAGLGVAMPMGAMSVLLLQEAMRHRRTAAAAAAGIAAVDLAYAGLATALGPWVASHVSPIEAWVRLASAAILLTIAAHGLTKSNPAPPAFEERGPGRSPGTPTPPTPSGPAEPPAPPAQPAKAFARYVGLTALNPTTALYFAALTTAQGASLGTGAAGAAFLFGVGAASLLWQQTLVAVGALAGTRISDTTRVWTFRLGYGLVAAYALKIAFPLPTLG